MIILGVDPGSLITGYAFLQTEGNRMRLLDSGPIRLKKHGDIPARLLALHDALDELIRTYQPHVLSIEKVFHGINFNSTLLLGYMRGVALMLAARHELSVAEYAPTEVKKAITGYGKADKVQMQNMVRLLLNLREVPKPHDVADAIAIAICHANRAPVMSKYTR